MDQLAPAFFLLIGGIFGWYGYRRYRDRRRARLIDSYQFPDRIRQKVLGRYSHLGEADSRRVMAGLREYFHLCLGAQGRLVAMPSQAVDLAWHEFILHTRQYQAFCNRAFGRFVHHTPAQAMSSATVAQEGIRRAWKLSCQRENIAPRTPHGLPLLFALDAQLAIPDGFHYVLDCKARNANAYCAGHIGCSSGCGGASCTADSDAGCSSCGGD